MVEAPTKTHQPRTAARSTAPAIFTDRLVRWLVAAGGVICVVMLLLIFMLLAKEGLPFLRGYPVHKFVTGTQWQPTMEPPTFGLLPLLLGSLLVSGAAVLLAVPLGVAGAVFLSEVSPPRMRNWLKPAVELLAAIPSVVMGFIGMLVIAPWVKTLFHLDQTMNGLTGAILLALMALPTIVTVAEDALSVVPGSYREASLALGATPWETIRDAVVPSAFSGLVAASMLGVGRALGETMTVLMVTGNASVIPHTLLQPLRTMTATIAGDMGEVVQGDLHYQSLFALGILLLAICFAINLLSDLAMGGRRGSGAQA
ncbi:MAG TPA: phosphate ABC transporter permease subunit PstC [Armatimonadota bacterium]|jgi:phosphate transport system permease protein